MTDWQATSDTATSILALTQNGLDGFTALSGATNHIGTVFGGRLIAQALAVAVRTVEVLPVSSLHAYFLAPGLDNLPLEYRVTRLRDSRRFANRQVTAFQDGQAIFTLICEFHAPEQSFSHQSAVMPSVPPPEQVAPVQQFVRDREADLDVAAIRNFSSALPVELRPVAPEAYFMQRNAQPERAFWFRQPSAAAIEDPRLHQCLLAFASDYWLAGVAAVPHVFPTNSREFLISSLDHAVWFHRPLRCDEWLLHHTLSPSASDGLGLSLGQIFDREGRLLASTAQECLLRRLDTPSTM
ncbi:acyl-CoA thioesterase [Sphingobium yanoikuyae]|uniref:Acyl-CoA thioesterase II n=1 Tax=Sphingobium yanoikuyae TaxID=13690 RepID=A0A291MZY9_SPHYA|nr:acyl-CoA thioesterase domain-containing protein [Sphingobium yanoikuyae]ATI80673.1 acyl-CoA thioesterase II [Sphingobium yanoikuyae]